MDWGCFGEVVGLFSSQAVQKNFVVAMSTTHLALVPGHLFLFRLKDGHKTSLFMAQRGFEVLFVEQGFYSFGIAGSRMAF